MTLLGPSPGTAAGRRGRGPAPGPGRGPRPGPPGRLPLGRRRDAPAAAVLALVIGWLLLVGLGGDAAGVPVAVDAPADRPVSAGLARTPPMGWNSWNTLGTAVRASDVRAAADALVSSGMRAAGYRYVIIDDGWEAPARGRGGQLVADPERFPTGIAALARYVHARGLKIGIYASPGVTTCQGLPGSFGHERQDAATFAAWGIDYLKYDACGYPALRPTGTDARRWLLAGFTRMRNALDATGRPIVLSINPSSDGDPRAARPWTWAPSVAQLWRVTNDQVPCWASTRPLEGYPDVCVTDNLDATGRWSTAAGPGHWNDLDMLTIGLAPETSNPIVGELADLATGTTGASLNNAEARSEMSVWSMLASPLLAGNDLTRMSGATRAILTNAAVIAVDQDPLGAAAVRVPRDDGLLLWTRPLAGGDTVVLVVNRGDARRSARLPGAGLARPAAAGYRATELWTGAVTHTADGSLPVFLAPHAAAMFRLTPATGAPSRPQPDR